MDEEEYLVASIWYLVLSQGCFEELNLAFLSFGGWSATARRPEMNKKYVVTLTDVERRSMYGLVSTGKGAASFATAPKPIGRSLS